MRRKLAFVLLLVWLLPALACNMPTAPSDEVRRAVLETLVAMGTLTPPAGVPALPPTEAARVDTPVPPPLNAGTLIAPVPVTPGAPIGSLEGDNFRYITQPGDTTAAVALRFGVQPGQILDPQQYPPQMMLLIGQELLIPNQLADFTSSALLMPDSEIVYSPSTRDFSVAEFIQSAGGNLSTYSETVDGETLTGAQIVQRVADETSTNPRMLLAVLEYRSGWVFGSPSSQANPRYPIGFYAAQFEGLHQELTLTARQLTIGYYGWRSGKIVEVEFANRTRQRVSPLVNAGTTALQYLFSKLYNTAEWQAELYDPARFISFYQERFGDPWQRARAVEPLLPDGLSQPQLELPFPTGESWTLTGGPHAAWGVGSPWGGLDFAPANVEKGCGVSRFWSTAAAPGLVVRSDRGQVIIDLDGDGLEQTGWALLYMHIAKQDRVAVGTYVNLNDPIGHPSCEGGFSTGTHMHISRKINGEWLTAGEPLPFVMSGWQAWTGERAYSGTLTKGDQLITARPDGSRTSLITR